jgi:hypothetical protein
LADVSNPKTEAEHPINMKSLKRIAAALFAACLTSAVAFAADPSGVWKWSVPGRDGQTRDVSLKLEFKDGQLTGVLSGGRGDTPITNGAFKDEQVTFSVVREFNGNTVETKYDGKLDGDTIKGSSEGPGRDGEVTKRDWTAKRST